MSHSNAQNLPQSDIREILTNFAAFVIDHPDDFKAISAQSKSATQAIEQLITNHTNAACQQRCSEIIEEIRQLKPPKLKSTRNKGWTKERIAYTGGWNAYYEEMQVKIKQVRK